MVAPDGKIAWGCMVAAWISKDQREAIETAIEALICPQDCNADDCNLLSMGSMVGERDRVLQWMVGDITEPT